jgi:hypothetical protein
MREGNIEFKEITKGVVAFEKPKYLKMDDFGELLAILGQKAIIHAGGNFMNFSRSDSVITEDRFPLRTSHLLLSTVEGIYYSPGEFHPYIIYSTSTNKTDNDRKTVLSDSLPRSVTDFWAKVIKYEDYEMSDIDRRILNDIREMEKIRNSQNI